MPQQAAGGGGKVWNETPHQVQVDLLQITGYIQAEARHFPILPSPSISAQMYKEKQLRFIEKKLNVRSN